MLGLAWAAILLILRSIKPGLSRYRKTPKLGNAGRGLSLLREKSLAGRNVITKKHKVRFLACYVLNNHCIKFL